MSTFSIVATPIGNLEDITLRALRILKEADVIFCEDTRVTGKLLSHYDIHTPTRRYDAHASVARHEEICDRLEKGEKVALVTDAGTPCVSDPGYRIINQIRKELPDVTIEVIPGPSALTAALATAGLATAEFVFLGFLPHKKGRQTLFKEIGESERAVVLYESPHRLIKTLESLVLVLVPDRRIAVARELTKIYESVVRGTAAEVLAYYTEHADEIRGECVVIIEAV
jgi:16S rRNA (cytidine1402-2'-O)-methyltransferase